VKASRAGRDEDGPEDHGGHRREAQLLHGEGHRAPGEGPGCEERQAEHQHGEEGVAGRQRKIPEQSREHHHPGEGHQAAERGAQQDQEHGRADRERGRPFRAKAEAEEHAHER
jgi:hypothetical protein